MTSGCFPGVSRLYQLSSSRPARNFHRKEAGTAASPGVVAVPRDVPKGTSVTGFRGELSVLRAQTFCLAEYQPRGSTLNFERQ